MHIKGKVFISATVLAAILAALPASAGVLKGAAEVVKGAAHDAKVAGKVAAYPIRHPKKTGHGVKVAAKKVAKA